MKKYLAISSREEIRPVEILRETESSVYFACDWGSGSERRDKISDTNRRDGMNVIDQAESLLEISNCSARAEEFRKGAADLLPGLVAECKRLNEAAQKGNALVEELMGNCNQLRSRAQIAEAEATRWQAAAIRERAIIIHIGYGDIEVEPSGDDLEIAEADLGSSPRAWLMSEERIKALDRAARFIAWADHAGHLKDDAASGDADIIQAMLAEAGQ